MLKLNPFIFLILFSLPAYSLTEKDAQELLKPLKMDLMGTLKKKLSAHGSVAALESCHLQAGPITEKYAKKIVGMGRTSHKLRNPDNAPQDWVKPYLDEFVSGKRKEPVLVKLPNGNQGYLEPIKVNGMCLICHGEKLSKDLDQKLTEIYPKDQARGFKAGDFRGLFWLVTKP
jgi:hypothetical protein